MVVAAAVMLVAALALAPLAAVGATARTRHEPPVPPEAGAGDAFGPDKCVDISRTEEGTCAFRTSCGGANLSDVEFAFVCSNPGTALPHALHSFGRGGFAAEEVFDTGVPCTKCSSVDKAFSAGGPLVRAALQSLPGYAKAPVPETKSGEESQEKEVEENATPREPVEPPPRGKDVPDTGELREGKSAEAAFYGPNNCIATFLSPFGTCIIQTRCVSSDLSAFNVGVTCLDASAAYSRYLFGRGVFEAEETFDTRLECELCLGVGDGDPATQQLTGALPKQLLEDVSSLKSEVQLLKEELGAILKGLPLGNTDGGNLTGRAAPSNNTEAAGAAASEVATSKPAVEVEATTSAAAAATTPAAEMKTTTSAVEATTAPAATTTTEALAPAPSLARAPAQSLAPSPSGAPPFESSTTPLVAAPAGPPPTTPEAETTTSAVAAASLAPAPAVRAAAPAPALTRFWAARAQPAADIEDAFPAAADLEDTPVVLHHRPSALRTTHSLRELLGRFAG